MGFCSPRDQRILGADSETSPVVFFQKKIGQIFSDSGSTTAKRFRGLGQISKGHMSNEKRAPGWLGYIGDYTTQVYRDYNKGSLVTNKYNGK